MIDIVEVQPSSSDLSQLLKKVTNEIDSICKMGGAYLFGGLSLFVLNKYMLTV